jgi:FAD/FMN-containing dehydrogenase
MSNSDSKHDPNNGSAPQDTSRRRFVGKTLSAGAAVATIAWMPAFQVDAGELGDAPTSFPSQVRLYKQAFENWAGDIKVDDAWTCSPVNEDDVLQVVNWAFENGFKVRARGAMHNWSPLTFQPGQDASGVLLIDTTTSLNKVQIDTSAHPAHVTAQTGVLMQDLMAKLETAGLGFISTPAPGDITLGGALAINGHGTAVPAPGEKAQPGHSFGSVSNSVLSLTAVVWEHASGRYVLKTFRRDEFESAAFLTHLGRAFITSATLQSGPNQYLRCQSFTDITTDELFAPPGSGGRTFASFLDGAGRIETITFPFTRTPWTKVWTVSPKRPLFSRPVFAPFNYIFAENLPKLVTDLIGDINRGISAITPLFGATQLAAVQAGLVATLNLDIWGASKNTLLYVKPSTLRVTANGYAILTRRSDVQRVVHEFVKQYDKMIADYQSRHQYPMNGPVEIRVTGLDTPSEAAIDGAVAPLLSALRPRPDKPEWDVAVWLDILTLPGTAHANEFYREMEEWVFSNYTGDYAQARVEWSKGWGYTDAQAWDNPHVLSSVVPESISIGQPANAQWSTARKILDKYDPARVFTSPLLDKLL